MAEPKQEHLFSPLHDLQAAQWLLGELHEDLPERVARFNQLNDLCANLGSSGTMIPGGETAYSAWLEARSSFVSGNFAATVMLCQGLAEHKLAAHISSSLSGPECSAYVKFQKTLQIAEELKIIDEGLATNLGKLMGLRNPLAHYRPISHPDNVSTRAINNLVPARTLLLQDATFAIGVAVQLLAMPAFRFGS